MADKPPLTFDAGPAPTPDTQPGPAPDAPLSFNAGPSTDAPDANSGLVINMTRRPEQAPTGRGGGDDATPPSGEPPKKRLDNVGEDDPDGFVKNTVTGALRMPTHVPGMLGEARDTGLLLGSNAASLFPGETRTAKEIRDDFKRKQAFDFDRDMSVHGPGMSTTAAHLQGAAGKAFMDAPTGADIYDKTVEPILGHYTPTTMPGRVYQAGLESALPMPGGKTAALERAAPTVMNTVRKAATSTPVVGGAMGATAEGVTEATGNPGLGLAASFAIPSAAGRVRPSPAAEVEAARRLAQATGKDTPTALDNLRQIAKGGYKGEAGNDLTLAEASGSSNIANVEKGHANDYPQQFGTDLKAMRGTQAEGQRAQLDTLGYGGDPMSLSARARAEAQRIEQESETATQHQQGVVDVLAQPEGTPKDQTGKRAFDIADANNDKAQARVSELYNSVDPKGTIHVNMMPLAEAAREQLAGINPRISMPAPEAESVLKLASNLPPTMSFKELVEFDKTVGQALWKARKSGDGVDLLKQLQQKVREARDGALDQHAAWEEGAVQRGELKPDATMSAKFAAGTGSPGIPDNQAERIGASQRLDQAKAGHATRMSTFEEGPVGGVLNAKTPLMGNVPASAFSAGPAGAQKTRAWMTAGLHSPQMLETVKDMAVSELAGMLGKDGVVTPKILDKWKNKFGSALSEIDRHEPGFSSRFDEHAAQQDHLQAIGENVQNAKDNFAKSALAKYMHLETPEEVNAAISSMMPSGPGKNAFNQAGLNRLRALREQLKNDPRAMDGLRAGIADWMKEKATGSDLLPGPNGQPVYGNAPGKFIGILDNSKVHLEEVFGPGGFEAARDVAKEMQRTKAVIDAKITRGGSDTASNLIQYLNETAESAGTAHGANMVEAATAFEMVKELADAATTQNPMALLRAGGLMAARFGMHKWAEAMARRKGAHATEQANIIRDALLDPEYGHKLLEHGTALNEAVPQGITDLAQKAHTAGITSSRPERASGGSVGSDHLKHARRMVSLVAKVRDDLGRSTKPLLNVHDSAIASALASAREVAQ